MAKLQAEAQAGTPGYKTHWKRLNGSRFRK